MNSFAIVTLGAAIPSLMLVYLVQQLDRFREPLGHVVTAFVLGCLSPIITLLISGLMPETTQQAHPWYYALTAAAIPEELGRALLLAWICTRWEEVGEPFDCIVYGVAVWAGFAATENVLYAAQTLSEGDSPIAILSMRASLCTLGHSAWGLIMGAYVGIGRFGGGGSDGRVRALLRGLLITITLHMLYDGLLMSAQSGSRVVPKVLLALSVDAISVVLAALFLIRARALQDAADHEGHRSLFQSELLKRHAPDSAVGLYDIIRHMHVGGVLRTLLAMFFSSMSVGSALAGLQSFRLLFFVVSFLAGVVGVRLWRGVIAIALRVHEETERELRSDIAHAVRHNELPPGA